MPAETEEFSRRTDSILIAPEELCTFSVEFCEAAFLNMVAEVVHGLFGKQVA